MIKATPTPTPGASAVRGVILTTLLTLAAFNTALLAKPVNDAKQDRFVKAISAIALAEQTRAGVPASITAAQAILESNWGRAPIAIAGNNYFGIKCKSYWTGDAVYHPDDDYDANGQLTESCFRAYSCVEESFRDHSDFLRTSERYASLFELSPTDYRGWAHGLRKCGYATDKRYGDKLVAIIERLELYALDWPQNDDTEWLMANSENGVPLEKQNTWMDIPSEYQAPSPPPVPSSQKASPALPLLPSPQPALNLTPSSDATENTELAQRSKE